MPEKNMLYSQKIFPVLHWGDGPLPDLGILNPVYAGQKEAIVCQNGYLSTASLISCTPSGWEKEEKCIRTRPPSFSIEKMTCQNGKQRVVTHVIDRGFPPTTDPELIERTEPCKPKCCETQGVSSSHLAPDQLSCVCDLHHLGFRIDLSETKSCCKKQISYHSEYAWREDYMFTNTIGALPCRPENTTCLAKQCLLDRRGCAGFNETHYFVRRGKGLLTEHISGFIINWE
jgi:hypothetical protein